MKLQRRGIVVGGLAATALVVAAFALRREITENYYLWKLRVGDVEERVFAASKLGEYGSSRAISALLRVGEEDESKGVREAACFGISRILLTRGSALETVVRGEEEKIVRVVSPVFLELCKALDLDITGEPSTVDELCKLIIEVKRFVESVEGDVKTDGGLEEWVVPNAVDR